MQNEINKSRSRAKRSTVKSESRRKKVSHHIFRKILVVLLAIFICIFSFCFGAFKAIIDSTPPVAAITLGPSEYATKIYDREGNTIATLVQEGSNREKATYEEIPSQLVNAFVSIEDARFWEHNGIDPRSIMRAVVGVLTASSSKGGGSTITQQLVKNSIFDGGRNEKGFEKYVRKFQEWYIATLYETQKGKSKKEIKENIMTEYLNTINLGANTLGVKVAARRYFDKDLKDLTVSECAVIAGITKNPSRYNPITHPEDNGDRRKQILYNMKDQGYITQEEYDNALKDNVYDRITNVNTKIQETPSVYSYFVDALLEDVVAKLKVNFGYSESVARNLLYSGGLSIYTTQDPKIQKIVDDEIKDESNYDSKKYSLEWRYTLKHEDGTVTNYSEKDIANYIEKTLKQKFSGLFLKQESAYEYIDGFKKTIKLGSDKELGEVVNFALEPQVSFVLLDQHNGEVLAINGGRGEKTQSRTLNRATATLRQPGSTFKVLSSFAPALEECQKTLADVYYDSEYTVRDKTFKNWYSQGYLGFQNIRAGIIYSLNIIAVRAICETVTPEVGVEFAKKLGITSLSKNDYNPASALGGLTDGVSNLELTNAFASIANEGTYSTPRLFTKIVDNKGEVLIDNESPIQKDVMSKENAFLLTDAMRESMISKRAFAGTVNVTSTSTRAAFQGMTMAGKSGTTTSNNDIWFVGFTPYYTAGVWGGCDENQSLEDTKTKTYNGGTKYHKNIWRKIMEKVHKGLKNKEFNKPDNIIQVEICQKSGKLPSEGCKHDPRGNPCYSEYFIKGTEPTETCTRHSSDGKIIIREAEYMNLVTDDVYYMANLDDLVIPNITTDEEGNVFIKGQEDTISSPPTNDDYNPEEETTKENESHKKLTEPKVSENTSGPTESKNKTQKDRTIKIGNVPDDSKMTSEKETEKEITKETNKYEERDSSKPKLNTDVELSGPPGSN